MNLEQFQINDVPLLMRVRHPVTGVDTDAVLSLLSPYDGAFLKRKNEIARDMLHRAMVLVDGGDLELRLTAAAVTGWQGLHLGGVEMVYSPDAAEKLLTDYPWLREQVVFFYDDAAKFFKSPAKD
jgi:hypothetical protein